jgi:type II secretion system protein D
MWQAAFRIVVAAAWLTLANNPSAVASPQGEEAYQAYPLRHQRVGDVEPQLLDLLRNVAPAPHVVTDVRNNQLLIRGPDRAQQIARQFLQSVDRPAVQPPTQPPPDNIVRGYAVPRDQLDVVTGRLQSRLANLPNVRVTSDVGTSQILVLAPEEIQALVARELTESARPGIPAREAAQAPPAAPAERFVQLVHAPSARLESQLRHLLGPQIEPVAGAQPNRPDYVFQGRRAQRVDLFFDQDRNGIMMRGDPGVVGQLARLVTALDALESDAGRSGQSLRILPVRRADPAKIREAVDAYRTGRKQEPKSPATPPSGDTGRHLSRNPGGVVPAQFTQPPEQMDPQPPDATPLDVPPGELEAERQAEQRLRELGDRVEIESLPDLDVMILRGRDADIDEVSRIIAEIERLSAETIPEIEIYQLRHVNCMSIATIISLVAQDLIGGRQGKVHLTPLVKPNALLLIGWGEAIGAMKELIARLDQPVAPGAQLRVYHLQHAPVLTVAGVIEETFQDPEGMAAVVSVIPDERTNSLIVRAAPRDLAEVDLIIQRLDRDTSGVVNQARVIKLKNTLATDLATTLEAAIAAAGGTGPGDGKSTVLELLTADVEGRRLIRSGLLRDVQITPDPHTNSLLVAAPADSMDLLVTLIEQLDSPTAVAQIKVFKIINGDASTLVEMLRGLLPAEMTIAGPQLAGAEGESTLVPIRFSVDARTNSIIATGSQGDLAIIEALLLRLDQEDVEERENTVYRLKNSPALAVAEAVNEFLRSRRLVEQALPGVVNPFEQIEREVIVVPEPVSNTLIISATPRYFEPIMEVVERLDEQPPQVMIQVVIAEVALEDVDELGVELGLQDSVLFDRSLLSGLEKITTTITEQQGGNLITTTTEEIIAATNTPGFAFNNQPLGNAGSDKAFASSHTVAGQGLSSFELGRVNSELGYGGMVLSASSDSVSVLIRALQQSRRVEILGRPQIMTLDNQSAFIQVGKRVPRIIGVRFDGQTQYNTVELENTGLILGVTPRISPEGMVVMEVDAEKSSIDPNEGVPISVIEGQAVDSPIVNVTTAQTTVSAASGETIVLGGLITTEEASVRRRVPYLADIPVLGQLFRYDSDTSRRAELLIFLTPRVVRNQEDLQRIKLVEAARMSWCLADVHALHGPTGIPEENGDTCYAGQGQVVYPDTNPGGHIPGTFSPQPILMDNLELYPPLEMLPEPDPATSGPEQPVPQPSDGATVPRRSQFSQGLRPTDYDVPLRSAARE